YLPGVGFTDREKLKLDSVLLLEQTASGGFVRHSLETGTCDHMTCAVGDLFGDGRAHLVTGNFALDRRHALPDAVTLWEPFGRQDVPRPEKPATPPGPPP